MKRNSLLLALLSAFVSVSAQSVRENFIHPPKGYGEVPFFWWNGDSLTRERLSYELDLLNDAAIDGFSVSYVHTHPRVDRMENANGYGGFGRADAGSPAVFTDEWWQLWNWFSAECAKRGMGAGLDDYVLGREGNGFYIDDVLADANIRNYQGRLVYKDGKISTKPAYELHPEYGKRLVEHYYQQFEDRLSPQARKGMNYFFQDELKYDLTLHSWCEDMPEQFRRRKGYDIVPLLPALFDDKYLNTPDSTTKIRLDYAEVLTQLAEERYFKPIYDWHASRGLIFGCDNYGRGMAPTQYLDYFRMTSWFSAPGNDAPARGSSFQSCKVSSSIAHMYRRPRTWLEAFHSMGWESNGEWLTHQLDHHLIAGGNLLCLHGLYYSTHGGWWEWAPPCFHFRMPYWPHMKHWLRYAERLCYLLSQGHHVCDIALLYPTETLQAFPDSKVDRLFATADSLSLRGLDYDYIDYQSLQQADIRDSRLVSGDESYRTLVLVDAKAMHEETRQKIETFMRQGGHVITMGESIIPEAQHIDDYRQLPQVICKTKLPDFSSSGHAARVLHRQADGHDIYMVMDATPGDTLFFRATGRCEQWNAFDGSQTVCRLLRQTKEGSWLLFDGEEGQSRLYVFTEGQPHPTPVSSPEMGVGAESETITLDGQWQTTLVPTMDNRFGDFRLPASNEIIGAEAREFTASFVPKGSNIATTQMTSVYGYAPYFETSTDGRQWLPYCYSPDYGVFDSPGSQGYHGLKEKVDHRTLILDQGGTQMFRTCMYVPRSGKYTPVIDGVTPTQMLIDDDSLSTVEVALSKGWHRLTLIYANTRKTDYHLENMKGDFEDKRDRSFVSFGPEVYYNPYAFRQGHWTYTFETAPATESMRLKVCGDILDIAIDGSKVKQRNIVRQPDGSIVVPVQTPSVSTVSINARPIERCPGNAFFTEPVRFTCGTAEMPLGDWTDFGALKFYSGGMKYLKHFTLNDTLSQAIINISRVNATCEISVNGHSAGILISPPYRLDITPFVQEGDNTIEILVYSTLSNHYATIPSPYRGTPEAGLMEPVKITVLKGRYGSTNGQLGRPEVAK